MFFDALGIPWEYEKEGYDLGPHFGRYLPDFFLPTVYMFGAGRGFWLEVKPEFPEEEINRECTMGVFDRDWGIVRLPLFDEQVCWCKYIALARATDRGIVLAVGAPEVFPEHGEIIQFSPCWNHNMLWMDCPHCRAVKLEADAHDAQCAACGRNIYDPKRARKDRIIGAVNAARGARFEHQDQSTGARVVRSE